MTSIGGGEGPGEGPGQGRDERAYRQERPQVPRINVDRGPDRGSAPTRLPSWQITLGQEIFRLRTALTRTVAESDEPDPVTGEIIKQLREAEAGLDEFSRSTWLRRRLLADSVYERALAILLAASEDLLLIEDTAAVQARIPAIRAALKTYIDVADPRFDSYLRFMDDISSDGHGDTRA